jgi:hypothetical protein
MTQLVAMLTFETQKSLVRIPNKTIFSVDSAFVPSWAGISPTNNMQSSFVDGRWCSCRYGMYYGTKY